MQNRSVDYYISKEKDLMLSVCSGEEIMSSFFDAYVQSNNEPIPPEAFDDLRRVASFCCAMAPFIPADGIYAWTVSLPFKMKKIFCAIDMTESSFVARTHKWEPSDVENSPRIALQKISVAQKINSVSLVDCEPEKCGNDPVGALLHKLLDSLDGFAACMVEKNKDTYILKACSEEGAASFSGFCEELEKSGRKLAEKMVKKGSFDITFKCGCDRKIISTVFSTLDKESLNFLFEKGDDITVECPRCGYKYQFRREEIETDE